MFGGPSLDGEFASIEHKREKRAHSLDPINRPAGQRSVAVVFRECDKEIRNGAIANEPKIRRKIITC